MSSLLVSAAELAAHPEWRVFDCRHSLKDDEYGQRAYAEAHIPGAIHLHLDRILSGVKTGHNGRHPLPAIDNFAAAMSHAGVGPKIQVIAYDSEGGMFAARLWWLLRWLGHEKVAVLDGGLPAWHHHQYPLDNLTPNFPSATFIPHPRPDFTVDATTIEQALGGSEFLVVDARSPDRYAGDNETIDPVGGHIPGAVNRFFMNNLDATSGQFKDTVTLKSEFSALLGARDPASVIQQCGSGVTACHNLLAMELAGLSGSRLYPGSWSEWCADSSRPVATGAA